MNKEKFYVAYGNNEAITSYSVFIKKVLHQYDVEIIDIRTSKYFPNLIIFTGGEDVNPDRYSQRTGKYTHINSKRDSIEENVFFNYLDVPKLGICRGSQFLTVMNGGTLIQHVENHANGPHTISFLNEHRGLVVELPSTHHQMMYPFDMKDSKYELIAYSSNFRSGVYLNGKDEQIKITPNFLEPEVVFYPNSNSLAVQPHPEIADRQSTGFKVIAQIIINKLIKK